MIDKAILEEKIIYEKTYPKESIEEISAFMTDKDDPLKADKIKKQSTFDTFIEGAYKDVKFVYLPERKKSAKAFVKTAIEISQIYELDVKVTQHYSHISVDYYFNNTVSMGLLKRLVAFADDISFFSNIKGYDILMSIAHYTHAVLRHGRQMQP